MLIILLGPTFVSADVPPPPWIKPPGIKDRMKQDRSNKQPPVSEPQQLPVSEPQQPPEPEPQQSSKSEPQQSPDYRPRPTSKKRFGCKLFSTVDVPNSFFTTTASNNTTTNSNSPQLWADMVPQQKPSETFVNTMIIAGSTTFTVVLFSGICLGYIVQRSRKKQESFSTSLESKTDTNASVETTEN
jgi:hypothetical protein